MSHLLEQINTANDIKKLSMEQLQSLCQEIRKLIIHTVGHNGGHLSSNLGAVELTVALHYVFDLPDDKIVWDVGHQAYTHKILTGRRQNIQTIRTENGLSGFPNRQENPCDTFTAGHASTSISAALGIEEAMRLSGNTKNHVIAVIGDGALTGGLAYEGLNNAGHIHKNLIVILNDNTMSISPNVGSISEYLAHIRTNTAYIRAKDNVEDSLENLPPLGPPVLKMLKHSKNFVKRMVYGSTLFDDLGFAYYGPLSGHDLPSLIAVLENIKTIQRPILLHLQTDKGKGYYFAEKDPGAFHGVPAFDIRTGTHPKGKTTFSDIFGKSLCTLAKQDNRICAITAAMQIGTNLTEFKHCFPNRFFDVGIAEEHAVTFAGGLAAGGMIPVCAIYSTFLQRGYDQLIHDVSLQKVKVVLAIDRAGIVGEDGETHQGIFDVAFLSTIPNTTIYAPSYYDELQDTLQQSIYSEVPGIYAVRYPRGSSLFRPKDFVISHMPFFLYGKKQVSISIVTYGRLFSYAVQAKEILEKHGIIINILKLNQVYPVIPQAVKSVISSNLIFFFEEGIQQGGIGEHFMFLLTQQNYRGLCYLRAINNQFVKHAPMLRSLRILGLDTDGMVDFILENISKENMGV